MSCQEWAPSITFTFAFTFTLEGFRLQDDRLLVWRNVLVSGEMFFILWLRIRRKRQIPRKSRAKVKFAWIVFSSGLSETFYLHLHLQLQLYLHLHLHYSCQEWAPRITLIFIFTLHYITSPGINVRRFSKPRLDATERPQMNARPQWMFELCVLRWISRKRTLPIRPKEKVMVVDVRPLMVYSWFSQCHWQCAVAALREPKQANSVGWH